MYSRFFKPFFDVILAFMGLVVLSPVFIVVLILLTIANSGKPFFFQTRTGKYLKLFKIIKFKTMNDKTDQKGNLLPDKDRLTKIGRFVRKTSLDELPQLINILKGDMSLIGPRPLLEKYIPYYSKQENKRHDVKPGITGYAQVNGRNNILWEKKFEYDVFYVNNLSLQTDLKIFLATIKNIILKKDVVVDSYEVEPDFDEYRKNK